VLFFPLLIGRCLFFFPLISPGEARAIALGGGPLLPEKVTERRLICCASCPVNEVFVRGYGGGSPWVRDIPVFFFPRFLAGGRPLIGRIVRFLASKAKCFPPLPFFFFQNGLSIGGCIFPLWGVPRTQPPPSVPPNWARTSSRVPPPRKRRVPLVPPPLRYFFFRCGSLFPPVGLWVPRSPAGTPCPLLSFCRLGKLRCLTLFFFGVEVLSSFFPL